MTRKIIAIFILGAIISKMPAQTRDSLYASKRVLKLMGTRFELTAISNNQDTAEFSLNQGISEIQRIEQLISSWSETSQTSLINQNAGVKPVEVFRELYDLIKRSIMISELSNGAFDITFASVGQHWKFDGSMKAPPEDDVIKASIDKVNYKNITLNDKNFTVLLEEKGMKIGFGGIGKGYAAERAKAVMKDNGAISGVVNAAGDISTWGTKLDGTPWEAAISMPDESRKILGWLTIGEGSVVTSGSYEKYFMNNGKRYSHIIDPRTGYPSTGIKSATIICNNAELGDALATTLFVLGEKESIELINQLKGIECLIITDDDRIITSKNLNINHWN